MPTTVTASNSVAYHLWQLPALSTPEPTDETDWLTIDNNLTDGYRFGLMCGFTAGNRKWKFTLPTIPSLDVLSTTVTDVNGALVSREQYIRSLYAENKATGTPFVYNDPQNSTNYFVDFEDKTLSMKRFRVKIFTTGITLVQVRLEGVTLP